MHSPPGRLWRIAALLAATLPCITFAQTAFAQTTFAQTTLAQTGDLSVKVTLVNTDSSSPASHDLQKQDKLPDPSPVVVWLSPLQPAPPATTPRHTFKMTQKDKRFSPGLLVIPVGSEVSFPNLDPFFHNVFSLFNGRRFDLGLYETGSQRSVVFPREGVSYIFCNIHPDMGAVIISLATPYFVQGRPGVLVVPHVPSGNYVLHVWSADAMPLSLAESARNLTIKPGSSNAAEVRIQVQPKSNAGHLNKYGKPYTPSTTPLY